MADAAQTGQGIGSLLGLFLGIREGDKRAKKARERKTRLTEKELEQKRNDDARKARLKLLLQGGLAPEQEQSVLSSDFGIASTTKQNIFDTIQREGFAPGSDEAKIFREEQDKEGLLESLRRFGIKGQSAIRGGATGAVDIPGIGRTPTDIAKEQEILQRAKTQESVQAVNRQREESFKALTVKRKRVETATASGKKSEKRLALNNLQGAILREIQLLDKTIDDDIPGLLGVDNPEIQQTKQRRGELTEELLEIRKELRGIGGIREAKKPKRIKQSDITKMSVDELFKVLIAK